VIERGVGRHGTTAPPMTERHPPAPVLEIGGPADGTAAREAGSSTARADASTARLRRIMGDHYDFVWRTVRFLGVPELTAEDAAQQVFCIVARKLGQIDVGAEMAFLFSTASRVASEARRAARSRPVASDEDVEAIAAHAPPPDEIVEQRRADQRELGAGRWNLPRNLRRLSQDSVPGHRILKYAEEHPSVVLEAIDDKTDALIRELEQKERDAARVLRRGPPRPSRYTPKQLAEVPF
jgi:DNA-directed RNA polymerase specialized sigma24 family protein